MSTRALQIPARVTAAGALPPEATSAATPRRRRFSPEERELILNRWAAGGVQLRELAAEVGRPQGSICTLLFQARTAGDPRAKRRTRDLRVYR